MESEEFRKIGKEGNHVKSYLDDNRTFEGIVRGLTPDGYVIMDVSKATDNGKTLRQGRYKYPLSLVTMVVPGNYDFEEDA